MKVSAYASSPQYWRHISPIVDALRARDVEVSTWARDSGSPWGRPVVDGTNRHELAPLMIVAAHQDVTRFHDHACVYVEHGAGQTYDTSDLEEPERLRLGFAGGGGLPNVVLFLAPAERVAEKWKASYPHAAVETVGCPALDRYYIGRRNSPTDVALPRLVAITAHWRFDAIPEGRPALPHFEAVLPALKAELARAGVELVGHAHPRARGPMARRWETLGVRYEPDPDVILSTASLLIADNTSLMYEAAAVDLPVLVLNAPWYRRDVDHGLRFWSALPGIACDEPADLAGQTHRALEDPPYASALRARAAAYAYAVLDGHAADRAADAILKIEGAPMPPTPSSEIQGHRDEVIDRLYQLGADDQMVAAVRGAGPEEIERLRRTNDQILATEIANARAAVGAHDDSEWIGDAVDSSEATLTDEEKDEAAKDLLEGAGDDDEIIAAVGGDAELAARVFRLEASGPDPSVGLLEALAAVAGIPYEVPAGATTETATAEEVAETATEEVAEGDAAVPEAEVPQSPGPAEAAPAPE